MMNNNSFRSGGDGSEPIRTAPADLYDRLREVDEQMTAVRRQLTEIHREYRVLSRHPDDLEVDTLGDRIEPDIATEMVVYDLECVDGRIAMAQERLADSRGRYASRLKLTEQAAADLDRRQNERSSIERTR